MDIVEAVVDLVGEDMEGAGEEDTGVEVEGDMEAEEPEALEVAAVGGGLEEEDFGEEEGDFAGVIEDYYCFGLIFDCIVIIICIIFIDFYVNFCKILFIYVLEVLYVENIYIYVE